jgi:hypothetical protein
MNKEIAEKTHIIIRQNGALMKIGGFYDIKV